jgi:hypothetical protein
VQLEDPGVPGALVQAVDVLGDQRAQPARPLEPGRREVRGVRAGVEGRVVQPLLPRTPLSVETPAPVSTVTRRAVVSHSGSGSVTRPTY